MFFVRSGWIDLPSAGLRAAGQYGYYWSQVSKSGSISYDLSMYLTYVNTSTDDYRQRGKAYQRGPLSDG